MAYGCLRHLRKQHTHSISGGGDKETVPTSIYVHYLIAPGQVTD